MSTILVDAFGERKAREAIEDAFGHLKAKPGCHRGYMIFGLGEYGEYTSIVSEFEDVSCSPWFYDVHWAFIHGHAKERGCLYSFVGEFQQPKGDKLGKFVGTVTKINPAKLLNNPAEHSPK